MRHLFATIGIRGRRINLILLDATIIEGLSFILKGIKKRGLRSHSRALDSRREHFFFTHNRRGRPVVDLCVRLLCGGPLQGVRWRLCPTIPNSKDIVRPGCPRCCFPRSAALLSSSFYSRTAWDCACLANIFLLFCPLVLRGIFSTYRRRFARHRN